MGRSKSALPDLTRAIELKPDFLPVSPTLTQTKLLKMLLLSSSHTIPLLFQARLQRGNILLKQGNSQEAREDLNMEQLMRASELEDLQEEAQAAYHQGDYSGTINALEKVIEISPWDPKSRELRADCYIRMGDPQKAIQDLTPAARLSNDNRAAFLKLSLLHYSLGEHHESLKECLKLDQDDKDCFIHYKQVKKLSKLLDSAEESIQQGRHQEAIEKFESAMTTEPNIQFYTNLAKERICFCLVKLQLATEAIDVCSEAHQREPRNANILRDRAEAYILNQDYEKDYSFIGCTLFPQMYPFFGTLAVEDYQEAREFDSDSNTIREGLERAQKMLKISRKRDYYKILGVSRNANKQEIIKAYRKLAQQWHPDNFQSEADKKEAEKKFIDIASAKEVLTDPGQELVLRTEHLW
ncbi:hypothetical protein GOODEAATRI_009258 [Goodea atripinnis]|uniref:J domain-containing protein n=1 Tax=Goodea atripinnis TaxID=208336 RepID=A0ABV0N974_9TELE